MSALVGSPYSPKDWPRTGWLKDSSGEVINEADILDFERWTRSEFNEVKTVKRSLIFSLNSVYPLSRIRNDWTGTVNDLGSEYELEPGAVLETADIIRYVPGFPVDVGLGGRLQADAEGRWGVYNEDDGFFWEKTSSNYTVGILRGGTRIRDIAQADWNIDRMDGNGPSGIDLAQGLDGFILQISYTYYGYGSAIWWVLDTRTGVQPRMWVAHIEGDFVEGTSTENPNLPIRVENTGTVGNIYCGGRQASIIGEFDPSERETSIIIPSQSVGDTWGPVASVQRKPGEDYLSFRASEFQIENTGGSKVYALITLAEATDLTGAGFSTLPEFRTATETNVQFDTAATAIGDGEAISRIVQIPASSRGESGQQSSSTRIRIPKNRVASVVCRCPSGSSSTVEGTFVVAEEW